jgi:hypothetical protein
MHPIERLRYVARVEGADPATVAREAAAALADVAAVDLAGLVPACRRLVDKHPANGPLWWLSARLLGSPDPPDEARDAVAALANDPTARVLAECLPEDGSILVVGWPDVVASALRRRGDVEVIVVDSGGEGSAFARRLAEVGHDASAVPDRGVASAATVCSLVIVEASAAGPGGMLAAPGSHAAAAVAARYGTPVWGVAGVGRILPARLWEAALARLDGGGLEPWDRDVEVVAADLLTSVVAPGGAGRPAEVLAAAECPPAPELLRPAV